MFYCCCCVFCIALLIHDFQFIIVVQILIDYLCSALFWFLFVVSFALPWINRGGGGGGGGDYNNNSYNQKKIIVHHIFTVCILPVFFKASA